MTPINLADKVATFGEYRQPREPEGTPNIGVRRMPHLAG